LDYIRFSFYMLYNSDPAH